MAAVKRTLVQAVLGQLRPVERTETLAPDTPTLLNITRQMYQMVKASS